MYLLFAPFLVVAAAPVDHNSQVSYQSSLAPKESLMQLLETFQQTPQTSDRQGANRTLNI